MLMELFDMVKRRRRRLDIDAQVVPVDELRAEILRTFRQVARQRSIRLDLARSEDCTEICVDRAIFLRVLENLLDNAFAYTPDGGSIEVRFFRGPAGGTEVSVCDSGVGIDETLRDQIFSPFCGRDGSHGGRDHMGLGLTFCKLAIESHGGSIATMTSRLGGSAFSIRLPGPTPVPCAADDSSQPLRRGAQTTQCFAR
jgi:signal transduction histidine kinase